MTKDIQRQLRFWTFSLLTVIAITGLFGVGFGFGLRPAFVALGLIIMFFLPGFALSFLLLDPKNESIVSRLTLSLAFSFAIEPTALFLLGYLGLPFTLLTSLATALLLALTGGVLIIFVRRKWIS